MTTGCGCGGGNGGSGGCGSSAKAPVIEVEVEVPLEPELIASSEQEWPIISVNGVSVTPESMAP